MILISGGWGYGNIGDDAILEATAKMLDEFFPDEEKQYYSYDPLLTFDSGIAGLQNISESIHRIDVGKKEFWFSCTKGKAPLYLSFPRYMRGFMQLAGGVYYDKIRPRMCKNKNQMCIIDKQFENASCFIMSGGGYFNTWQSCFDARIKEIVLAHRHNCKTVLIGQSFGPFTEMQQKILQKTLSRDDAIYARDSVSIEEMSKMGFTTKFIPDLALYAISNTPRFKKKIVVVPTDLTSSLIEVLAAQIELIVRNIDAEVEVTLTRLWHLDIIVANKLVSTLRFRNITVDYVMPSDYRSLIEAIGGAEWVISRGLHALILGWRSGSNVFAITTSRKVDGFMSLIGCEANQCDEFHYNHLADSFLSVSVGSSNILSTRSNISVQVKNTFASAVS